MERPIVEKKVLISQLLTLFPEVAGLFIELRVDCIGCSLNRFCTVSDMCEYYDLDHASVWDQLLQELA